jgi:hypothetical protein
MYYVAVSCDGSKFKILEILKEYISYTLKYTVFNATLSFPFLFIL